MQRDGSRVTRVPSVFRRGVQEGIGLRVFWVMVVYWNGVEVGGFKLGTPQPLEIDATMFSTLRYREVDNKILPLGTTMANDDEVASYFEATQAFMPGQSRGGATVRFLGGLDQIPSLNDASQFQEMLHSLIHTGSSFRMTSLGMEVLAHLERQAGASDLSLQLFSITSGAGVPVLLSDQRALSAFTIAEFESPIYENQQGGETLGDGTADELAVWGLGCHAIRSAWVSGTYVDGTVHRSWSLTTRNKTWACATIQ